MEESFRIEDTTLLEHLFEGKKGLNEENYLFCQQYIQKLSSYTLSKLTNEPENLKEEHGNILHQTQTLAFENYQTFIQAAECSREVYKDFNIIEDHLNSASDNLPKFTDVVENFSRISHEINLCRRQNSLVLSRHTQLLEILEISQLMDTCVRNGYYEEALELSHYVKRLDRKFSNIKIIKDIANEVQRSTQYMLSQLLQQLKGNIQLPACLRIVSYVRQLEVFSEPELRIKFLQGRDAWFQVVLAQISKEDAYTHLTKVIDASRVSLFDIITQYKAIFSDADHFHIGTTDTKKHSSSSIINSWILNKLSQFLKTMDEDISSGLHGRLDSLYGQCMYFGLSFSRIGADFRGIIVPFFCKHTISQFKIKIDSTTKRFEDDISTYTVRSFKKAKESSVNKSQDSQDPSIPPHALLEFSPIAHYVNGVLTAFNDFRQFPSISLVFQVRDCLRNSLEKVMSILENWAKLESQSLPSEKVEEIQHLCEIVCRYFLPYLKLVFETVFNFDNVQKMMGRNPTGVTSTELKKMCTLDLKTLAFYLKDHVDIEVLIPDTIKSPKIEDVVTETKDSTEIIEEKKPPIIPSIT